MSTGHSSLSQHHCSSRIKHSPACSADVLMTMMSTTEEEANNSIKPKSHPNKCCNNLSDVFGSGLLLANNFDNLAADFFVKMNHSISVGCCMVQTAAEASNVSTLSRHSVFPWSKSARQISRCHADACIHAFLTADMHSVVWSRRGPVNTT